MVGVWFNSRLSILFYFLIHMSVSVQIPCCFDYCGFVELFEVWEGYASCLSFFLKIALGILGHLWKNMEFLVRRTGILVSTILLTRYVSLLNSRACKVLPMVHDAHNWYLINTFLLEKRELSNRILGFFKWNFLKSYHFPKPQPIKIYLAFPYSKSLITSVPVTAQVLKHI